MKIKELIINVLAVIIGGWFWFGWAIPKINFNIWIMTAEEIKFAMTFGFILAVLMKLIGIDPLKSFRKTKNKTPPSKMATHNSS